MINETSIFNISSPEDFLSQALAVFKYQFDNNTVYNTFCKHLNKTDKNVKEISQIPFLPIEFYKTKTITSGSFNAQAVFTSSGTTGQVTSKHHVKDLGLYKKSFDQSFIQFYGDITNYCILALLPSYLERTGSSLTYMVNDLINESKHPESGFYLDNITELAVKIEALEKQKTPTILIGVSFALLDLVEKKKLKLKYTTIMETGGMKGRRKEIVRPELHRILTEGFGVNQIHSEYGMTELLSQAYSTGNGIFNTPPWMKVVIRDPEDPLTFLPQGKSGGVNVIDLANIHSCSFIATQDLGKSHTNDSFEILGRFDQSDIRGCNLMVL